ncbi:MAG: hypothetical protein ACL7BU_04645 [Candidatus Phlomobacter fragariae]
MQSDTIKVVILLKKDNAKTRAYAKFGEILKRNEAQRALNQALKKAFWRHEDPRQQLLDYKQKIVTYTNLFMQYRKRQQKQKLDEQKAHIDAHFFY